MEVVPLRDAAEVAVLAADAVEGLVRRRPGAVLGLPTRQVRCDRAAARGRLCERSKELNSVLAAADSGWGSR